MILALTGNERLQFQTILPIQGDLKTLELVDSILSKVKINDISDIKSNEEQEFEFNDKESELIHEMIKILDSQQQLQFTSLSLIKKIIKET
jgi:2C-methyl-D-erythritol 2,4-cyclodiphosphate synthase